MAKGESPNHTVRSATGRSKDLGDITEDYRPDVRSNLVSALKLHEKDQDIPE